MLDSVMLPLSRILHKQTHNRMRTKWMVTQFSCQSTSVRDAAKESSQLRVNTLLQCGDNAECKHPLPLYSNNVNSTQNKITAINKMSAVLILQSPLAVDSLIMSQTVLLWGKWGLFHVRWQKAKASCPQKEGEFHLFKTLLYKDQYVTAFRNSLHWPDIYFEMLKPALLHECRASGATEPLAHA